MLFAIFILVKHIHTFSPCSNMQEGSIDIAKRNKKLLVCQEISSSNRHTSLHQNKIKEFVYILYIVYLGMCVVATCLCLSRSFGCAYIFPRNNSRGIFSGNIGVDTPCIRYVHRDFPEFLGFHTMVEIGDSQEASNTAEV